MPTNVLNKHKVRLGFIGLGIMGSRLAQRLHASGWNIQAWNRSPEPARELMQAGVPIAASVVELVADSDVILSSLADDVAVHSVYCGPVGVFAAAKPGTIILEMSIHIAATVACAAPRGLHAGRQVPRSGNLRFGASG